MGQKNRNLSHVLSAIFDFLITLLSIYVAFFIIMKKSLWTNDGYAQTIAIAVALFGVVIYFIFDIYSNKVLIKLHKRLIRIIIAHVVFTVVCILVTIVASGKNEMYFIVLISAGISLSIELLKKTVTTKLIHYLGRSQKRVKKILIVGCAPSALEYERQVNENKHFGYKVIGCVTNARNTVIKKLGSYNELDAVIKAERPHEVVIALGSREEGRMQHIMEVCDQNGTRAMIIPTMYKYFKSKCQVDMIGNLPIINTRAIPLDNAVNAVIKRIMDIIISLVIIIITLPIMIFAFIGVKLTSKGPAIFKQKRVGKNNEEFVMYKFRSMRVNNESDTAWTTDEDKRKTKFGTFMRKTGIDELPQFFNVLFGSMSIIGPRPELPKFVEQYSKTIPLYKVKHQVKPGITGLAQIYGFRGNTSIERRIELDIKYIEDWSVFNDIKILVLTPFKMFNRNEKYVE